MFQKLGILSLVIILGLASSACNRSGDPKAVADSFWKAAHKGDVEAMKKQVTKDSQAAVSTENDQMGKGTYTLGETKVEDGRATVDTVLKEENGESLAIKTVLVKEEGAWKVDLSQTAMSLFGGAMQQLTQGLGEAFKEGMQGTHETVKDMGNSMKDMEKSLNEAMKGLEDQMKKAEDQVPEHTE